MKFFVRTYGCQMNVADSNEMSRHLTARGLVETQDPDDASVILVNTCTVRQHAEDRAFSEIGRLRRWKASVFMGNWAMHVPRTYAGWDGC